METTGIIGLYKDCIGIRGIGLGLPGMKGYKRDI